MAVPATKLAHLPSVEPELHEGDRFRKETTDESARASGLREKPNEVDQAEVKGGGTK